MAVIVTQSGDSFETQNFVEDLTAFFQAFPGFTVTVSHGGTQATGFLDMPSEVIADGVVLTTDYSVIVEANVFSAVVSGDTFVADGVNYTVREPMLLDDGKLMRIMLMKD